MLCLVDVDTALCYVNVLVRNNAVSTSSRLMSEIGDIYFLNPVMLLRFVSVGKGVGLYIYHNENKVYIVYAQSSTQCALQDLNQK